MNKNLPVDELLRLACIYAEQDRESIITAYANMPDDPEAVKAGEFLKQLRVYRRKRWGRTKHEQVLSAGVPTPVSEIAGRPPR